MIVGYFCALACTAALAITGNTVTVAGVQIGRYEDDSAPGQCQLVAQDLAMGWPLVIAAVPPGAGWAPYERCAGAVQAQEWYPFGCPGVPASAWGPLPAAPAYIFALHFAWPGCRPPSASQRSKLLAQAERRHPWLILWY